jgi:hypothetical protein
MEGAFLIRRSLLKRPAVKKGQRLFWDLLIMDEMAAYMVLKKSFACLLVNYQAIFGY